VSQENSWQAKPPDAFSTAYFAIDWEQKTVTCPAGHHSVDWQAHADQRGQPSVVAHFSKKTCAICPLRQRCTHSEAVGRSLTFRPKTKQQAFSRLAYGSQQKRLKSNMRPVLGLRVPFRKAFASAIYATPATSVLRKLDFSRFSQRLLSILYALRTGLMNTLWHALGAHPSLYLRQRLKRAFASSIGRIEYELPSRHDQTGNDNGFPADMPASARS
jgi:hypothetical protein